MEDRFAYGNASSVGGRVDLLLADAANKALILSPYANYLVATQQIAPVAAVDETNPSKLRSIVASRGSSKRFPAVLSTSTSWWGGSGIHHSFESWGKALLGKTGKQVPSKYLGDNLKYPVYWDDYGAYYRAWFQGRGFQFLRRSVVV
ncbi:MAG TPA: hypothetical protein VKO18_08945 [Terriglobia bacterium]|nr:hypothetical protein [Terriglobia bacterium]